MLSDEDELLYQAGKFLKASPNDTKGIILQCNEPSSFYREMIKLDRKMYSVGRISPRFYIYSDTATFEEICLIDLYYGSQRLIRSENKSSSEHQVFKYVICTSHFIEKDKNGIGCMICFLLSNMGFLLCTVEINIPNDKFIIHQVKEVVIEGLGNQITDADILIDQSSDRALDDYKHLLYIYWGDEFFSYAFRLETVKECVIPRIVGDLHRVERKLFNLSVHHMPRLYDQMVFNFNWRFNHLNKKYVNFEELRVLYLNRPTTMDNKYVEEGLETSGFNWTIVNENPSFFITRRYNWSWHGMHLYVLWRINENNNQLRLKHFDCFSLQWNDVGIYNYNAPFKFIPCSFINGDEECILIGFREKRGVLPKGIGIYNMCMITIGHPQSLTKLAFFAVRRLGFVDHKYEKVLRRIQLPSSLQTLPGFVETRRVHDENLQTFVRRKRSNKLFTKICMFSRNYIYRFINLFVEFYESLF